MRLKRAGQRLNQGGRGKANKRVFCGGFGRAFKSYLGGGAAQEKKKGGIFHERSLTIAKGEGGTTERQRPLRKRKGEGSTRGLRPKKEGGRRERTNLRGKSLKKKGRRDRGAGLAGTRKRLDLAAISEKGELRPDKKLVRRPPQEERKPQPEAEICDVQKGRLRVENKGGGIPSLKRKPRRNFQKRGKRPFKRREGVFS